MNEDFSDTALAQTAVTLTAIRPIAMACIGAGAALSVLSILLGIQNNSLVELLHTAIFALVSFAATRHVLSDGQAPLLGPTAIMASPAFLTFVQLELLVTCLLQLAMALADLSTVLSGFSVSAIIILILLFARFGTLFPAIVAGGDTSLTAAAGRGTTGALLLRLIPAYGLGFALAAGLILGPSLALEQDIGVSAPLTDAIIAPFMAAINVFVSVLIAVILSKAYQGRYRA